MSEETRDFLIGPAFVKATRGEGGWEYESSVWIGGKGIAEDGRWGENLQLTFTVPYASENTLVNTAEAILAKYGPLIKERYGEKHGWAMIAATWGIIAGKIRLDRPRTLEELGV